MSWRWRVIYDDGSEYTDLTGPMSEIPKWGALVIDQPGQDSLYNKDYYIYRIDYNCWIECDLVGLVDNLVTAVHNISAVLVGRTVPRKTFKAAMRRLNEG